MKANIPIISFLWNTEGVYYNYYKSDPHTHHVSYAELDTGFRNAFFL